MKKRITRLQGMVALLCFLSLGAHAADLGRVERQIKSRFQQAMAGFQVASVKPSPIAGLYEVQMLNGPLLFATATGDYFFSGDLFSTADGKLENITELTRKQQRVAQLEAFPPEQLIVFSPKQKAKHWVAVFTDPQCGYCRKFHSQVGQLNDMGIEVRYFSFPIFNGSRENMVSALCSDDPRAALTTLKSGGTIPAKTCDTQTIDAQFELARQFGLSGTPGIVLEDGTLLKGYVEPAQLAEQLGM